MKKLLCLSNGHGEDAIAIRILKQLQLDPHPPQLAALPIVGEGQAYTQLGVPIVGRVKPMPSGGFIYMDNRQLARDLQGGLLPLLWSQVQTVRSWAAQGGVILAVGDIVPLCLAWLSGADYAFVGTAKSEYYLRNETAVLARNSWWDDRLQIALGSVYYPWERWLMARPRCQAVFPRDSLTAKMLQQRSIPALDLGNPMMDDLAPTTPGSVFYTPEAIWQEKDRLLTITLLPGSRVPEAYNNWQVILQAVASVVAALGRQSLLFLGAIAPRLNLEQLRQQAIAQGWRIVNSLPRDLSWLNREAAMVLKREKGTLILTQESYNDCLHEADLAIAMAGTATEQFVGLGKPAIAIPGSGPQFTPAFAEAQSRLLGSSLILVQQPMQVGSVVQALLRHPDRLQEIADNGVRRMGHSGASARIAGCLMQRLNG